MGSSGGMKRAIQQGQIFDPPESGYQPAVSAEEALAVALHEGGVPGRPSGAEAKLVSLTTTLGPQMTEVPAWVVSLQGVCVPVRGGMRADVPPSACAGTTWNALIDAETGAFIAGYASGPLTVP